MHGQTFPFGTCFSIKKIFVFSENIVNLRSILLDVAQLVAHLVRDQEVAGSSPVIQTSGNQALTET